MRYRDRLAHQPKAKGPRLHALGRRVHARQAQLSVTLAPHGKRRYERLHAQEASTGPIRQTCPLGIRRPLRDRINCPRSHGNLRLHS